MGPDDLNINNNPEVDEIKKHSAQPDNWEKAAQWARKRLSMDTDAELYMIIIGHAEADKLMIDSDLNNVFISADELNAFVDSITTTHPTYMFLETCYSGSFIDNLKKEGRFIVASSQADQITILKRSSIPSFSFLFWTEALKGKTFEKSFSIATDKMKDPNIHGNFFDNLEMHNPPQKPELYDGGFQGMKLGWTELTETFPSSPPLVIRFNEVTIINNDTIIWKPLHQPDIIDNVWAIITPSAYQSLPLNPLTGHAFDNQPKLDFLLQNASLFGRKYQGFVKAGSYNVTLYAENVLGVVSDPLTLSVKVNRDNLNVLANIDMPEYLPLGESLNIDITANTEIDEGEYHQYHAVVLPDGQMLILSGLNTFLELSRVRPFTGKRILVTLQAKTWKLVSVPNTTGLPTGKYTWYSIFVAPGDSPFNTENWLGMDSQEMYIQ